MTQEPIAWLVSPDGGIQLNNDYWQLTLPSKLLEWKIPLYLHPSNDEALLRQALEALEANRRSHYYCEDTWYSCPQHEEGCANEAESDECNCGADEANEKIDEMITALRERLGDKP